MAKQADDLAEWAKAEPRRQNGVRCGVCATENRVILDGIVAVVRLRNGGAAQITMRQLHERLREKHGAQFTFFQLRGHLYGCLDAKWR